MTSTVEGFVPPVYPFDKLTSFTEAASRLPGGMVDLSVGTPCDPPLPAVVDALAHSGAERGYPAAAGSAEFREAVTAWVERRFAVRVDPVRDVAPCIGTKELVAGVPHWLSLRTPGRDTVLYPSLAYPTYEMGAILGRCRAVAVPAGPDGRLDLHAIDPDDAERALCLWVNSPGNPAGQLEDLGAAARWGRRHRVPVFSDECYVEFTWAGGGRGHSILEHGLDGVVAVHSLSKRSNFAGARVGYIVGDPEIVGYLAALRRHAGFMVPGPVQHAAAVALGDDEHVAAQRDLYARRLSFLADALCDVGIEARTPDGGFYLWVAVPEPFVSAAPEARSSPAFAFGQWLAEAAGVLVSPGDAYGAAGRNHVRFALVQPMDGLELVKRRLVAAGGRG